MKIPRRIGSIHRGNAAVDGAGVHLVRVIGVRDTAKFDPFLMLDAFDSTNPEDYIKGFPWHPHRGIETITYLIEGEMDHGDSLGNQGTIHGGEAQWMTAGSGIIHQEMPKASPRMLGAQIWLNLPRQHKMAPPAYHSILAEDIPAVKDGDALVRVVAGRYGEVTAGFSGQYIPADYLDVTLVPGGSWSYDSAPDATLFVYLVQGSAFFTSEGENAQLVEEKSAVRFTHGDTLGVQAGDGGVRMLLLCAQPLHEPIAWGGPIVMNTQEELDAAFRELQDGTFLREKGEGL